MLIIFDWDGTLCDSLAKITHCMQCAAQDLRLPTPSDQAVRNIVGLGLPEAIHALYPDISDADLGRLQKAYSKHFIEQDQEPSPLYAGVEDALIKFKETGHLLTVATGKSRRGLDRVLKTMGWDDFFDGSRCADETASKPHPMMLEELLAEFQMPASDALMVGDTEYDMEMAKRASVPRVGVSYGAHAPERLHQYDLELCVDHFHDFCGWVGRRWGRF